MIITVRRHWVLVVAVVAAVGVASYQYSASQSPVYSATADVLLSRQNLATSLNNIPDPGLVGGDANRSAQTQASLATTPMVLRLTLKSAGLPATRLGQLAENSTVRAAPTADILTFSVEDPSRGRAVQLAAAYARSYTSYRKTLDNGGIERALTRIRARLSALRTSASPNKALITSLSANEDRLSTLAAFQSSNALVVRSPTTADQVSPRPKRALLIGLLLGGLLGVGVAMLRHRLDSRLQVADEVSLQLRMSLLARIPEMSKKLRDSRELVMLSDPHGPGSEAFRVLRTNIEFGIVDGDAKTIMVTSAVQAEGKSTVAANLAVAFARAGRRVVLVDLDMRRPSLADLFELDGQPGLSEVALGRLPLGEALTEIDLSADRTRPRDDRGTNGIPTRGASSRRITTPGDFQQQSSGTLRVLTSGPMPPDTGEFVGSDRVRALLGELSQDADLVLVDAPPLLIVSDALAISPNVQALLFVARLGVVRRPMLSDALRALQQSPARVLGVVVTDVPTTQGHAYAYEYHATNESLDHVPLEPARDHGSVAR